MTTRNTTGIAYFSSFQVMVRINLGDESYLSRMANVLLDPDYYEARAIVLSKMGSHKQALAIYVFQLKDYKKAEE